MPCDCLDVNLSASAYKTIVIVKRFHKSPQNGEGNGQLMGIFQRRLTVPKEPGREYHPLMYNTAFDFPPFSSPLHIRLSRTLKLQKQDIQKQTLNDF